MWDRFLPSRRRRGAASAHRSRGRVILSLENLEYRAMLTATPVGSELLIAEQSSSSQRLVPESSDVAVDFLGQSIVAFHGRGVAESRQAGDDREVFLRRFGPDGEAIDEIFRANEITRGDQADPAIDVDADGNYFLVWSGRGEGDRTGIFGRRFDSDGTPLGEQFLINTTRGGDQLRPDVAVAPDGSAVVVWDGVGAGDMAGVFMQRFTSDGTRAGGETLVNTTTAASQLASSVAIDAAGNFVVTWSSRGQDGDGWGIFGQRFAADGTPQGNEFRINTTTTGSQHHSAVAMAEDGTYVVSWSSLGQDGDSWGVFARVFDPDGVGGIEFRVNDNTTGHQRDSQVAMAASGEFVITWSDGQQDGSGWETLAKTYDVEGVADGDEIEVNRESSGVGSGHQRASSVDIGPDGTSMLIFHGDGQRNRSGVFGQLFSVEVAPPQNVAPEFDRVDDQDLTLGDILIVTVEATDRNRTDTLTFRLDTSVSPADAELTQIDNNLAVISWTPTAEDRNRTFGFRVLVDDDGDPPLGDAVQFLVRVVNIPPSVDLNGADGTGTGFEASLPETQSSVAAVDSDLTVVDEDQTELTSATITLRNPLDGTSEILTVDTTGTNISSTYDAARGELSLTGVDPLENYQRVLRTLRYVNNASLRTDGIRRIGIVVNDGTSTSEEVLSQITVVGPNQAPTLPDFETVTVIAGSPLHIPLDGFDANGDPLTYTATSSNSTLLETFIPQGNRSMRVTVSSPQNGISGDMVFQLFEDRASRATSRIIQLADDGFYDGIIFHRVVNNFVIQGGDPTGTGSGGSDLGDFDDQFHRDLQHNRTGMLSMAKTVDDTNDSQFFVTEGPARHLDFNHTVFGMLVEGEEIRELISNVPVGPGSRPVNDVVMQSVEIFTDQQRNVLMLKAPEGASGSTTISITVADGRGGTVTRQFTANVLPDTVNNEPFLADIGSLQVLVNTSRTIQLNAVDVEGDPVFFFDEDAMDREGIRVPERSNPDVTYSVNPLTGELTVSGSVEGVYRISVAVASQQTGLTNNTPIDYQVISVSIVPELNPR
jgi:cyclophilin family peptidyl-prolyl cis-trans isomerase